MRRHVFARVLASTVLVLTATEMIGGGTPVGAAAPPSLDGQRFFWSFTSPSLGESPLNGTCHPDGMTSLALDLPTDFPTYDFQYLPDIGNWGSNPYPDLPYTGPMTLSVTGTLGAQTLQSPPLDYTTGWLNEQQSTRGLPAAPVTAFAGTATIDAPDADVVITLSIPETGAIGYGSCHDPLLNAFIDMLGPVEVAHQFRLKVMNVEYTATITTSSGVYHDTGTAVFSARGERYINTGPGSTSAGGGGMEMIFTSTAPADSDGPTITCPPDARVLLHQDSATVTATVSDEGSGVSSPTLTVPVDTSVVGPQTVSLTATDLAGNSTTVECTVVVAYVVEFRNRPGHHDDDDDGHGHGHGHGHDRDDRRRHGAEVVRWRLLDADGRWAGGPSSVVSVTVERPGHPTTILGGSAVSYQRRGRWQATVRPRLATGDAVLVIALDDSTTHAVALR